MSIGGTLEEAREQAGLSIAQVSQQTRIRETIIRSIESGDYRACGGDFYARGHIRIIATVVGADPEPLIGEYDATCRAPGALSAVSLDELLTSAEPVRGRRRPGSVAMLGLGLGLVLAVAAGLVTYQFLSPSSHDRPAAAPPVASHRPAGRDSANPAAMISRGTAPHAHPPTLKASPPSAGLAPVSAAASTGGGNPRRAPLARPQARDGQAHRPAGHRLLAAAVTGHAPAARHGPSGHAHGRADWARHRHGRGDRARHRHGRGDRARHDHGRGDRGRHRGGHR